MKRDGDLEHFYAAINALGINPAHISVRRANSRAKKVLIEVIINNVRVTETMRIDCDPVFIKRYFSRRFSDYGLANAIGMY